MQYFEDFQVGDTREFGNRTLVQEEIIAFGREFDPQPFHVDLGAARDSIFGGLIASGWHTVSLTCRMFTDHALADAANLGGIGADELRWLKPVRPGDTLHVRMTIVETKLSASKPDRGMVRFRLETLNQADECVATATVMALVRARP